MANPAHKKGVRGGHRASATKMIRKAEELLARDPTDYPQLAKIRLSLQEKVSVLKKLDAEIVDLVKEDEVADEIERADAYMEDVYDMMAKLEEVSKKNSLGSTAGTPTAVRADPATKVRLPKLMIQPFKGDLTNWVTFWDSYVVAIHSNSSLSDIEKFNYLRTFLEGPALEAIAGLTLTAANYQEAVEVLKQRFGNKQRIIDKHMEVLLGVDAVSSDANLKALRRLYDTVEAQVRGLKAMGVTAETYGGLLSSVMLSKVPPEIRLIISRAIGDGDRKLDGLMKLLLDELQARERSVAGEFTPVKSREKPGRFPNTAAALLTGSPGTIPTCYYCQQAHRTYECKNVKSIDERRRILREAGRCFVCLRKGHIGYQCPSTGRCSQCRGRHHTSICAGQKLTPAEPNPRQSGTSTGGATPTTTTLAAGRNPAAAPFQPSTSTALWADGRNAILLQTAQTTAFNLATPERSCNVRIVFDSGSQRSYVTEQVARRLLLATEGEKSLTIMTFGSTKEQARVCKSVRLGVALKDGTMKQLTLFAVPTICEPIACQPVSFCQRDFDHLAGIELADSSDGRGSMRVDLLIGSDQYWDLVTGDTRRGVTGPVALQTKFGWVLSGPTRSSPPDASAACLVTHTLYADGQSQDSQMLDARLKSFWELESFGIVQEAECSIQDDFATNIHLVDGRYEVQLPWKKNHPVLPDNYHLALKRLRGLGRRLKQDPAILREYDATIQSQIQQDIVEPVEPLENNLGQVHYLPHHAVVRGDKETTKLRVVYDASAHSDGPSLNDCLHVGPKLNQKILDILLRFRVNRIAIVADIEKAFLMVSMAEKDRDVLRFLWFKDALADQHDVIELRFTRVVFGVSSSPFLLNATLRHHLDKYESSYPNLIRKLRQSLYVDDLASGAPDEEQAYQMFVTAKKILKDAGFNLRKFYSSSESLQARVNPLEPPSPEASPTEVPEESYTSSILGGEQKLRSGEQKVLGIRWNTSADRLLTGFEVIASAAGALSPTKRSIVSLVGRFYDPIGYLAPVVIQFKIFLRELCQAKIDWDEPLPADLMDGWSSLCASLQYAQPLSLPRCYLHSVPDEPVSYSLCGFCDASQKAYAGVVYLLVETSSGYTARFVAAKTRVAPLQPQTIPRLELLSALLLSRLLSAVTQSLESEMQLSPPRCFTDSTVSLGWIKGVKKTWKVFVQNRVTEIRRLTTPDCWSHCPGKENPADIPSRGLTPLELSVCTLWRCGPSWLGQGAGDSLAEEETELSVECLTELRSRDQQPVHALLTTQPTVMLSRIMDCEKFGSMPRLIATTARVLEFCWKLLARVQSDENVDFRNKAEHFWILECQQTVGMDKNFKHWCRQLDLFRDETGLWRCKGRIQNAAVPYSTKHPILLPKNHHVTSLLVMEAHCRVLHNGVKETLTELRERFWIIRGRSIVKKVIHQCRTCRRHEGAPYSAPRPPPLPKFRVEEAPPFTFTGVDFAGPLYVKSGAGMEKVWICLYTCCVVRAVHLDLVSDQTTPTFLRSFRRFVARRGVPCQMISDNGKTFKAASTALREVKWVFNVPKAPWWGGVFERLVKCVKRCLKKMVGQAKLSTDELLTVLLEVEMVLNSRPLTVVSAEDMEEPLTPSHMIVGRRIMSKVELCPEDDEPPLMTSDGLTRRARHLEFAIDQFWHRWRKEYLVSLREMHGHYKKVSRAPRVAVGDVVVIHSDKQARGQWKLGRVEKLLTGHDGQHRAAVLRVAGQGRTAKRLQRPVQRLYPIEMAVADLSAPSIDIDGDEDEAAPPLDGVEPTPESTPPVRRSQRTAARTAADRLLAQTMASEESEDDEC